MSRTRNLVILLLVIPVLLTHLLSANLLDYDEAKVVLQKGVDDNDTLELDYLLGNGAPPSLSNSSSNLKVSVPVPELIFVDDPSIDLKDRLRPKKKPKGELWPGWTKIATSSQARALPRNIGNSNQWWRNSRQCFEVDQICHGVQENEWFYYMRPDHQRQSNVQDGHHLFQPTMELKSAPAKYDGGKDRGDSRISIKVTSSSILHPDEVDVDNNGQAFFMKPTDQGRRCQISSTSTHIVLQSLFNDMIGEFYSRTLVKLYHLMMDGVEEQTNTNSDSKLPWEEIIQFYAHIAYGNKKMLDGHKLLLSGMLSDPDSPSAKSFVDLFVQEEGAGGSSNSSDDCQCYEKMVFCGYDVYTHDVNVLSKDLKSADNESGSGNNDDDNGAPEPITSDEAEAKNLSFDYDIKYALWSANKLDDNDDQGCNRDVGGEGDGYVCQEWNDLRSFLATNFHQHYPTLEKDVIERRIEALRAKVVIEKGYTGDSKEFLVIGLTQRTYRRSWINLPDILEKCNAAFGGQAICVEVNVEHMTTPYEQLVMHRSLDALIGVHGAQLTQAVLLPPHGHVLELLPWIPDYTRGNWVQTTNHPTPLGVIFHNTDLNHLGYSLDRNSVPLCQGVQDEELQSCFMKQRKKFIWENRDFVVDSDAILKYIQKFVIYGLEKDRTCDEIEATFDKRFVLYNIWCLQPNVWFLDGSTFNGGSDCIHGSSVYRSDNIESVEVFDSREECCTVNRLQCQSEVRYNRHQRQNYTLSVLHSYHELKHDHSSEEITPSTTKAKRTRRIPQVAIPGFIASPIQHLELQAN